MTKHTAGPWATFGNSSEYLHIRTANNVTGTSMHNSWGFANIATCYGTDTPEQFANAQLIAAAPDLLNALQEIADLISESQGVAGYHLNGEVADWDSLELSIFDAIKKATGEQE